MRKLGNYIKNYYQVVVIAIFVILMLFSTELLKNFEMTELWFTFIGKIFSWPVAILIIFIKFQSNIIELISRISRLRIGENEINFFEMLQKVEEGLSVEEGIDQNNGTESTLYQNSENFEILASMEPKMAILQTWGEYEKILRTKFTALQNEKKLDYYEPKGRFMSVNQMMFQLNKHGLIRKEMYEYSRELGHLRNSIAHGQDVEVSTEMALEYNKTLEKLKKYIQNL